MISCIPVAAALGEKGTAEEEEMETSEVSGKFFASALEAFVSKIHEKVKELSEECWITSIPSVFKEMNNIIEGGQYFGVTKAEPFSEEELLGEELNKRFRSMRVLGMKEEARALLVAALEKKGLETAKP